MESFLLARHTVYFQHSLQGLVAAMAAWQCKFFKILQNKKRGTEACNLHSASIMHRAKSWEVLLRAWHNYVRVGLHDIYFCIGCIKIDLKAKGGYTNL